MGRQLPARHHPDSVRRVVARGKVTEGGHTRPPRMSGHMMAAREAVPVLKGPLFLWRLDTVSFSEGEKEMGSKRGRTEASAPTASEEGCSVPLLPGRRKLHIRWLLLPFPKADRCAGSPFGGAISTGCERDGGTSGFGRLLFLFFTGRGGSFLSQRRERKEWGRKLGGRRGRPYEEDRMDAAARSAVSSWLSLTISSRPGAQRSK